jgi:hypothetical protein
MTPAMTSITSTGPCIKGTAFQAVVDDLQRLARSGDLSGSEVEEHLAEADAALLRSGVLPGSWYPIESYRRMLQLLVAKQSQPARPDGPERDAYLRRRGVAAAERILKLGLYNHLDAAIRAAERNPTRWVEQVGRVMTTLSAAMFNFSRWEFVPPEKGALFTLNAAGARELPEETRILLEGFIASLFEPFTDAVIRVQSRRATPDLIVYSGRSESGGLPRLKLR